MTAPRGKIEASLAERGRPTMWANEQEAAVLSGVAYATFRRKLAGWEARGFPRVNQENGKRSIPGILAFWGLPMGTFDRAAAPTTCEQPEEEEDGLEIWGSRGDPDNGHDQFGRPVHRDASGNVVLGERPGRRGTTRLP
jgi:hypothetical protein